MTGDVSATPELQAAFARAADLTRGGVYTDPEGQTYRWNDGLGLWQRVGGFRLRLIEGGADDE